MLAARAFWFLGFAAFLLVGSLLVPWLAVAAVTVDLLVLIAVFVDYRAAAATPVGASDEWPPSFFQGQGTDLPIEVANPRGKAVDLRLRHGLHPALCAAPRRTSRQLPPERSLVWRIRLEPRRRGSYVAQPLTARVRGPLGLAWHQRELLPERPFRVLPQVRWGGEVGKLIALAHRRQLGSIPYSPQGAGGEIYALREYLRGDPLNKIHWKATARHDRPISREETWERGMRLLVLIDTARSMMPIHDGRSKLDYALAASLALARVAAGRGDQVTVTTFADRIEREVRVGTSPTALHRAYSRLFDAEARLTEPAYDLAARYALDHGGSNTVVLLMTSVVDMVAAEVLRDCALAIGRRHRPLLVNMLDPELYALLDQAPDSGQEAFAQIGAVELQLANEQLARRLRRAGVRVVHSRADQLGLETLNAYFEIVGQGLGGNLRWLGPASRRAAGTMVASSGA